MKIRIGMILFLILLFTKASKALNIQYTDVDTSICNINTPVLFRVMPNWANLQYTGSFHIGIHFGDGTSDTLTNLASSFYPNISTLFYFSHSYTNSGVVTVKVFLYDSSNVLNDSVITNYNIGACSGIYSGTVFYDPNNNCVNDIYEAPLMNRNFSFSRNGVNFNYLLDSMGQFNLPIYNDTIEVPTGQYNWPNCYIGTCMNSPITSTTFSAKILVSTLSTSGPINFSTQNSICLTPPLSYTNVNFSISRSGGFGNDEYKYKNLDTWNQYASSGNGPALSFYDYFYNGAGTYTYHYGVYEPNYYGPTMIIPITFHVDSCAQVQLQAYFDNDLNCGYSLNEIGLDSIWLPLTSQIFGQQSIQTDSSGNAMYSLFPGDTVSIDPIINNVLTPFQNVTNLNLRSVCNTNLLTYNSQNVKIPFDSKVIMETINFEPSQICKNDTVLFSVFCSNYGIPPGTSFSVYCKYGDGIIDTINSMIQANTDTVLVNLTHIYINPQSYNPEFVIDLGNGILDSLSTSIYIGDCKRIVAKTYYDLNNNCIQDVNEPFISDFKVYSQVFSSSSSIPTQSASIILYGNDYINKISDKNQFGYGQFFKTYNQPTCPWIDSFIAYQTYIFPLNEDLNYISSGNTNFSCTVPYLESSSAIISLVGNHSCFPFKSELYFGDGYSTSISDFFMDGIPISYLIPYSHLYTNQGAFIRYIKTYDTINNILLSNSNTNGNMYMFSFCGPFEGGYFADSVSNCILDTLEEVQPYLLSKVNYSSGDSMWKFTNFSGFLGLDSLASSATFHSPSHTFWGDSLACLNPTQNIINYSQDMQFPYRKNTHKNDWGIEVSHSKYGANMQDTFFVFIKNKNAVQTNGTLTMNYSASQNYLWSSLSPSISSSQQLTWNFNANSFIPKIIKIVLKNGSASQIQCSQFLLSTLPNETEIIDNQFEICDSLNYGFQPFSMNVTSFNALPNGNIDTNGSLIYKFEFTNTLGNDIYNLKLFDTISTNLDLSSLQILYTSQPLKAYLNNDRVLLIDVTKTFKDILVDSNESKYCLIFGIKPISNLNIGSLINNQGLVIASGNGYYSSSTNVTYNKYGGPNGFNELNKSDELILVYPNPATDVINLKLPANTNETYSIQVKSIDGRVIQSIMNKNNKVQINLSNFPRGNYFLEVHDSNSIKITKFSKI